MFVAWVLAFPFLVVEGFTIQTIPALQSKSGRSGWIQSHGIQSFAAADSWTGASSSSAASGGGAGHIEQIEFKIYPDGRVEETVRGIKGGNCHKVTEEINKHLGEVVASAPTEEMFEQEVVVNEQIRLTDSDWNGSSSW